MQNYDVTENCWIRSGSAKLSW